MHRTSLFLIGLLMSSAAVAQTSNSAVFDGRPANIPLDYLATPSGWFHPSCVIQLGEDEKLDLRGNVVGRKDGMPKRLVSRCMHPRFDPKGREVTSNDSNPPPAVNGWIVGGGAFGGTMDFISANWTVPSNPRNVAGQTPCFSRASSPARRLTKSCSRYSAGTRSGPGRVGPSAVGIIAAIKTLRQHISSCECRVTLYGYVWGTNCSMTTRICPSWQILTSVVGGPQTTFNTDAGNEVLN